MYYIGTTSVNCNPLNVIFYSRVKPNEKSHSQFDFCTGGYKNRQDAEYMARYLFVGVPVFHSDKRNKQNNAKLNLYLIAGILP